MVFPLCLSLALSDSSPCIRQPILVSALIQQGRRTPMAKIVSNGLGIELHGSAGNAVFAMTRYGLVLRPRTQPKNPRTAAQTAARARLAKAAQAWRTLTAAQHAAWQTYATTIARFHSFGGAPYSPAPHTIFIALGSKYLQVHPTGTIPVNPPTYPFTGDGIKVTATGGAGKGTFTATGANSANVVTELLLQPLLHASRAPKANLYRPKAFVSFANGQLSKVVNVTAGWYAPAVRFVRADTGQEGETVGLGAV